MSENEIDLQPVNHITTDAIGQPGKRIFYLQGWHGERTLTLIVEKLQIQSLAVGVEQFLADLYEKFPDLEEASADYDEEKMRIVPPVDPLFRVGEIGLGYDIEKDWVVLITKEFTGEEQEGEETEGRIVRFWCTRSQLRAMCRWGIEISSRGRPLCPQCGAPMDPAGHFCPKKNGHKH